MLRPYIASLGAATLTLHEILQARLGLSRRDLCTAMVLLGGDFSEGAKGLGTAKVRALMTSLKAMGLDSVDVVLDWARGGDGGVKFVEHPKEGGGKRPRHCSK